MATRTWWGGLALVSAVLVAGCGGSGNNNDQGIVFRAGGTFQAQASIQPDQITCTEPVTVDGAIADNAASISLSTTRFFPDENDPFGDPCGGWLQLINNLSSQFINVTEVSLRYDIPGAAIEVGPWSVSLGASIPPTSFQNDTPSGQANVVFVSLLGNIVPEPIIAQLNQNVNRLPSTPYVMNVFIVARGQSDQGTNYETNEIGYTINVTD
ncbi:MAG: hypothetical protein AB1689_25950 [Thermodesulfobacteriota bacterium]